MYIELLVRGERYTLSTRPHEGSPLEQYGAPLRLVAEDCDPISLTQVRQLLSDLGEDALLLSDGEVIGRLDARLRDRRLFLYPDLAARGDELLQPAGEGEEDDEPPGDEAEPSETEPVLVQVQWLDGTDHTYGGGSQWVNLPRDAKWADGEIVRNIDRLSHRPRLKVRFNRPGGHSFKLRMQPGASNLAYSGAEKGRNARFTFEENEKSYTTDGDGTKIIDGDMFIESCGNNKFVVEGEDSKGTRKRTSALTVKKLIFYQEIKMQNAAGTGPLASIATSLSTLRSEYAKHGVRLEPITAGSMPHMENISTTDSAAFQTNARGGYSGSAKEPYVVAIGYTGHLAVKDASQTVTKSAVTVGPTAAAVTIPIVNASGNVKYLWNNIVTGEGWFVSCTFTPNGGGSAVAIPAAKVTAVTAAGRPADMCDRVRVDVTGLAAATGTITLRVNWVNRMRAGLSFPGGNLVCVCTRAWWSNKSTASQNEVLVHEVGHKFGMVSDGTGKLPDKPAFHYTGKGHIGDHCHHGQPVLPSYSGVSGDCTIFGATNGHSDFCEDCTPVVRKLDLSDGWSAF